ncbi:MAG: SH3 domain-containing protein [Pyrinomonadaceae bacterium]|nr:SH3 domain-containing protein [Pyrinomonadaceae bacterium]
MNCPSCNQINENENLFCVSCGGHLSPVAAGASGSQAVPPTFGGVDDLPPTRFIPQSQTNQPIDSSDSVPTAFISTPVFNRSMPNFNPSTSYSGAQPVQKSSGKFVWIGALVFLLLIGGGIGAYFLINKQSASAEMLPDYLGLFFQNKDKNAVSEITKRDFPNAVSAKDELLKNESLPTVEAKPNLILYADGKDVPLNDLKLVQLDSIKDDGTLKQINFQPAPIDGKPEMKRLRIPDGLANGKYAFALFDGFLDEGKHKFWAFQVKNADKSDNGDLAKALTLSMKPQTSPTPAVARQPNIPAPPTVPPPSGASVVYCTSSNVVLRAGPSQSAAKIGNLYSGQRLYVLGYSDNYESFTSKTGKSFYSNYVRIQTDNGKNGWVYRAYTR